jgi:tRNA (guanine37-N1)-methyltransferase
MNIDIISCQPDLLRGFFEHSIIKNAGKKGKVNIEIIDLRDFGLGKYRQIDDYQFGGGAGMVMMMEPLVKAYEFLSSKRKYDEVIYFTPDGTTLKQGHVNILSLKKNILMVCGHYKGIDQRFRDHYVSLEISIGDFVLSGGEIPAALLTDAIIRLIPGVLNDETSALLDSFQDNLLAPPVYTRPADFHGSKVPDILLSGNEKKIEEWRLEKAIKRTKDRRPDLMKD